MVNSNLNAWPRVKIETVRQISILSFVTGRLGHYAAAAQSEEVREAFAHLHAADPALAALIDRRPDYDPDAWRQELPEMDLFGCLLLQITGQQISVAAARAILDRVRAEFDGRMPSPDIMLRNAIKRVYRLEAVPSEDQVLEIAAAWHPHGSLGVNLLFTAYELDREGTS